MLKRLCKNNQAALCFKPRFKANHLLLWMPEKHALVASNSQSWDWKEPALAKIDYVDVVFLSSLFSILFTHKILQNFHLPDLPHDSPCDKSHCPYALSKRSMEAISSRENLYLQITHAVQYHIRLLKSFTYLFCIKRSQLSNKSHAHKGYMSFPKTAGSAFDMHPSNFQSALWLKSVNTPKSFLWDLIPHLIKKPIRLSI